MHHAYLYPLTGIYMCFSGIREGQQQKSKYKLHIWQHITGRHIYV